MGHPAQLGEPDLVGDAAGGGPRLRGAPADRRGRHRGPPEGSAAPPGVADDAVSVLPDRDHRADRRRSRAGSPAAGGELRDPDRADGRHRAAHRGGDVAGPRGRGPRRADAHDPAVQARQVPPGAAARDHHDGARGLRGAPRPAVPAPRDCQLLPLRWRHPAQPHQHLHHVRRPARGRRDRDPARSAPTAALRPAPQLRRRHPDQLARRGSRRAGPAAGAVHLDGPRQAVQHLLVPAGRPGAARRHRPTSRLERYLQGQP